MHNNNINSYKWFMAGTMLGALGMGIGIGMRYSPKRVMHRARCNAASVTAHLSRQAGNMIGDMGESLAHRIRYR